MSNLDIIENTVQIQSVFHKKLNQLQAVFYQAGTLSFQGISITVDRPCALILKHGKVVTVSNPSQTYSNVLVSIKNKDKTYSEVIELPTNDRLKGTSATVNFQIP